MPPSKELFDEIYREKIRHSRTLTGEQRVLLSFELTDAMLRSLAAGIRCLCPEADERDVLRLVCNIIEIQRQLENLTGVRHRWDVDPIDGSLRLSIER